MAVLVMLVAMALVVAVAEQALQEITQAVKLAVMVAQEQHHLLAVLL
jgi:hypothetical protein